MSQLFRLTEVLYKKEKYMDDGPERKCVEMTITKSFDIIISPVNQSCKWCKLFITRLTSSVSRSSWLRLVYTLKVISGEAWPISLCVIRMSIPFLASSVQYSCRRLYAVRSFPNGYGSHGAFLYMYPPTVRLASH